jgi:nitrogen fixation protein NifB
MEKFENHPCFSPKAMHTVARIHLPVAPKCNIQCNYCNRDFDCINESRPGVTSSLLTPRQALSYLDDVMQKIENVGVIGIAGPGDPFANNYETIETFRLAREKYPDIHLCVATNGLELPSAVNSLVLMKVNHVTVTVNAVDPEIGAKMYAWVRTGAKVYRGIEAANLLLERQIEGIRLLKENGITVKINTVVVPGINDAHVEEISRVMGALGADIQNCIPMYRVDGTAFENIEQPSAESVSALRLEAGKFISQMSHCQRCRADAAGLLGKDNVTDISAMLKKAQLPKVTKEKPYVAIASCEGLFVNQHLGEAKQLWVYGLVEGRTVFIEKRDTPPAGGGAERWRDLANLFKDCCAILASGFGESPMSFLEYEGIHVMAMQGLAKEGIDAVLNEREIPKILRNTPGKCGAGRSCGGTGSGCA